MIHIISPSLKFRLYIIPTFVLMIQYYLSRIFQLLYFLFTDKRNNNAVSLPFTNFTSFPSATS